MLAFGSLVTVYPAVGSTRAQVSRPFGFVRVLRIARYVRLLSIYPEPHTLEKR